GRRVNCQSPGLVEDSRPSAAIRYGLINSGYSNTHDGRVNTSRRGCLGSGARRPGYRSACSGRERMKCRNLIARGEGAPVRWPRVSQRAAHAYLCAAASANQRHQVPWPWREVDSQATYTLLMMPEELAHLGARLNALI